MFATLLIANRGEIACRVIRTARRLGIATVAVYSDADGDALHVRQADRAIRIGPAPARDSYLSIGRIIDAARRSGAQAVHPGYGFLSENPDFADACTAAGLVFVGPSAASMRAMGSKSAAKALMANAGVPLLPGYHGDDQDPALLAAEAARIGFPVMVKAAAGGGGRGMRAVADASRFADALAAARQEAASAFGDDRVLIERCLERPRHLEVQVFGDRHGRVVHLFERDCSAQRRHQKVIEEAPAPGLDPARRAAMGTAAVAAARAVDYVGAGTVEFVADAAGFYFLEMNTRLQVEHPVTEMVTGFDLVEWQLRVAAGEPLPATQDGIAIAGHAIEARLYAEDPERGFAPAAGRLARFRLPGDRVRLETGVVEGDVIGVHYDAMLAKLVSHAPTRAEALGRLRAALAHCEVAGVASNLDLLAAIAAHPEFAAGPIDTGFIARHADELLRGDSPPPADVLAVAALGVLADEADAAERRAAASADPGSPWHATDGWWLNANPERLLAFDTGQVRLRRAADGWWIVAGATELHGRAVRLDDGRLAIDLDGDRAVASVTRVGEQLWLRWRGATWRLLLPDQVAAAEQEAVAGARLTAPIPGQITAVDATPGQAVRRGQTLVVLEAMKTVFRLGAPADAVVATVTCRQGQVVQEGQVLVSFAEAEDSAA